MKKRIISAIIMLLLVIPIVWYGGPIFRIGVGVVSALALIEFIDLPKTHHKLPLIVSFASIICLLLLVFSDYQDSYSIMYGISYRGLAIT